MTEQGGIAVDAMAQTSVPGVYAAGDISHPAGMPFSPAFVSIAVAQGTIAAGAIDRELLMQDLQPVPKLAGVTVHVDPLHPDGHDAHANLAHHDSRAPAGLR